MIRALRIALVAVLAALPPAAAIAAIFANDIVYLHDGDRRITDTSVIVVAMPGEAGESWSVCASGRFFLRQGPTWSPGPYRFIRTRHADIAGLEAWRRSAEARGSPDLAEGYARYLQAKAADAVSEVEVTLPSLDESPPLDRTPSPPPRPGMAEGRLGFDRHFKVDLASGRATQLPARPQ